MLPTRSPKLFDSPQQALGRLEAPAEMTDAQLYTFFDRGRQISLAVSLFSSLLFYALLFLSTRIAQVWLVVTMPISLALALSANHFIRVTRGYLRIAEIFRLIGVGLLRGFAFVGVGCIFISSLSW